MFTELNKYIKEFEKEDFAMDYWYDEGATIAENMMKKFQDKDWESMLHELPKTTIGWKRRLAYCLHDANNLKELEILLELIDTDDPELFEVSVDSLRSYKHSPDVIKNNPQIVEKIELLMPNVGVATQQVFMRFLGDLR